MSIARASFFARAASYLSKSRRLRRGCIGSVAVWVAASCQESDGPEMWKHLNFQGARGDLGPGWIFAGEGWDFYARAL